MSVRLRLTLSYAGFLMIAGGLLLATVWVFLLRYVPDHTGFGPGSFGPTRTDLADAFTPRAVQALAVLLVFGLVGGWFLSGGMLAPLTRITHATRRVASGSLSHRIELEGRQDEFRELADSFDAMLARLEAHVSEQQRFAANASHELRTPLAITQTLLDVARKDPHRDVGELLDRLQAVNTRAIALTEALLLLSRADQRSFGTEPLDLSLVAEEVTETLLPLAERHGVTLEPSGDPAPASGSPTLLLQLATNLVHNAIVHNLAGHGAVWITTAVEPDAAVLAVENTGEELSPRLVSTLAEPFRRGTDRVHADHSGVGLGLAIVDRIARAHDGTLTLQARPGGGLRATVRLPRPQPGASPPTGSGHPTGRPQTGGLRPGPTRTDRVVPGRTGSSASSLPTVPEATTPDRDDAPRIHAHPWGANPHRGREAGGASP